MGSQNYVRCTYVYSENMQEIKRDVARHLFFVVQWRYRILFRTYKEKYTGIQRAEKENFLDRRTEKIKGAHRLPESKT